MLRSLRSFDATPSPMEAHTALALVAFIALLLFQGYALFLKHPFDPAAFGEALGWILGGSGGVALGNGYLIRSRSKEIDRAFPEVD